MVDKMKEQKWVIYLPERGMRVGGNRTLNEAIKIAKEERTQLICLYVLYSKGYFKGSYLKYKFFLEGLSSFRDNLIEKNIHFKFERGDVVDKILEFAQSKEVVKIVTDYTPLREGRAWRENLKNELIEKSIEILEIDCYSTVPMEAITVKQEFAARTIRPKVMKILDEHLIEMPKVKKFENNTNLIQDEVPKFKRDEDKEVRESLEIKFIGGESEAKRVLENFLDKKLTSYNVDRNDAGIEGVSDMSPYLAHGQIYQGDIAMAMRKKVSEILSGGDLNSDQKKELKESSEAYIEELIVRSTLAENFCAFNKSYDSYEGFPTWAKVTLDLHDKDKRDYIYSETEFENTETHDELWNAAQNEMKRTGKMHGYMRMYWAKKILEWTEDATEAMNIAVYLNDKYEIDGQTPNGYTGCAWSIGGLHDRPWFKRNVYGTVRYMAVSGCAKKFDIKKYINKWNDMDKKGKSTLF